MDFGEVGLGSISSSGILCSNSNKNVSFASDNIVSTVETNWFGYAGCSNQERTMNDDAEEDLSRVFKAAKTSSSSCWERFNTNDVSEAHRVFGISGAFTPSQWVELKHQALIFRYINANVPVPNYLLDPIRKAFESAGFSCYSGLRSNPLGLGFSNTDPEPGRCRRTDGKKWRCSRDAVADHKYCERHMNRGRHRSRKPVEGHNSHSNNAPYQPMIRSATSAVSEARLCNNGLGITRQHNHLSAITSHHHQNLYDVESTTQPEFGFVCSDSLLNPVGSSLVNLEDHENDTVFACTVMNQI